MLDQDVVSIESHAVKKIFWLCSDWSGLGVRRVFHRALGLVMLKRLLCNTIKSRLNLKLGDTVWLNISNLLLGILIIKPHLALRCLWLPRHHDSEFPAWECFRLPAGVRGRTRMGVTYLWPASMHDVGAVCQVQVHASSDWKSLIRALKQNGTPI